MIQQARQRLETCTARNLPHGPSHIYLGQPQEQCIHIHKNVAALRAVAFDGHRKHRPKCIVARNLAVTSSLAAELVALSVQNDSRMPYKFSYHEFIPNNAAMLGSIGSKASASKR